MTSRGWRTSTHRRWARSTSRWPWRHRTVWPLRASHERLLPVGPNELAFKASWEGRAFAISLLSMNRLTGQNLDAMRHALERLHPLEYLRNGYYGRWLLLSETLLTDSGVIAP